MLIGGKPFAALSSGKLKHLHVCTGEIPTDPNSCLTPDVTECNVWKSSSGESNGFSSSSTVTLRAFDNVSLLDFPVTSLDAFCGYTPGGDRSMYIANNNILTVVYNADPYSVPFQAPKAEVLQLDLTVVSGVTFYNLRNILFSADGLTMYIPEGHSRYLAVHAFTMTTAYGFDGLTYSGVVLDLETFVGYPNTSTLHSFDFILGGTKLMIKTSTDIIETNLSVAYDPSTATIINTVTLTAMFGDTGAYCSKFIESGKAIITSMNATDKHFAQVDFTTPGDISTAQPIKYSNQNGNEEYPLNYPSYMLGYYLEYEPMGCAYAVINSNIAGFASWPGFADNVANSLVDFTFEIDGASTNRFKTIESATGDLAHWDSGALSALVPLGGGTMTHFVAIVEDRRGGKTAWVGTITATDGGGDMEFSSTTVLENDVIEIDTLKFKFNGLLG